MVRHAGVVVRGRGRPSHPVDRAHRRRLLPGRRVRPGLVRLQVPRASRREGSIYHRGEDERDEVGVLSALSRPADDIRTVNVLNLQVNRLYHYELHSKDVLHSFSVPAFRLKQDAVPGRAIVGWFRPTVTGEFDIQCAEICGIGHGLMPGRVRIRSAAAQAAWMETAPRMRQLPFVTPAVAVTRGVSAGYPGGGR
ncbi:MAG: hypothetical protein HY655_02165 [Acidobacteria bacterium]|nr:hypothetical protein [Acidobacteriota bacterium]